MLHDALVPFILFGAGLIAGAMNAVAGGGSFLTLPAMILAGVPSVAANASSTVALCPGSFASAWGFREYLGADVFDDISNSALLSVSVAGGLLGALLLIVTPTRAFDAVLPWLLLFGTLAFAYGRQVGMAVRRFVRMGRIALLCTQFLLGVYGGYFGGAIGIMMLAAWNVFGASDVRTMNAAKAVIVGSANAIAVVIFIIARLVWWHETLVMLAAAVLGGYAGARLASRISERRLRSAIVAFGMVMTAAFFYRAGPGSY